MDISTLTLLSALVSTLSALPVKYDQRQDGDLNVQAHLDNFLIVFIPNNGALSLSDIINLRKDANRHELKFISENEKYVPPSTAMKSTSPNFPAGISPYKVDLDKQAAGEKASIEGEVLIAQSAPVTLSKVSTRKEAPTTASSEEVSSTKASVEVPLEEVKKADPTVSSDKTGAVLENTEKLAVSKDESDHKESAVKVEKNEKAYTGDSKSQKPEISPKAIEFASLARTSDDIPTIYFVPTSVRSSKSQVSKLEPESVDAERLKLLRSGLEEDCRDCRHTKSRSDHFFQPDSQRLQMLRFGLTPAVD